MSDIAIVGGHGQVARRLVSRLADRGHQPIALVRDPGHAADLPDASIRLLDIENSTVDDFAAAFAGCDAVVFAAGGGPDGSAERKRTVDLAGSLMSIQAAEQLGIRRFVQVSAMGVDAEPDPERGAVWAAYVHAKRDADAALRSSGLDWTIVRPGRLTDDAGVGLVRAGASLPYGQIPRADVAAVLAAVLDDARTVGCQFDLISGEESIADALSRLG